LVGSPSKIIINKLRFIVMGLGGKANREREKKTK
jgi:hypothetical protein